MPWASGSGRRGCWRASAPMSGAIGVGDCHSSVCLILKEDICAGAAPQDRRDRLGCLVCLWNGAGLQGSGQRGLGVTAQDRGHA